MLRESLKARQLSEILSLIVQTSHQDDMVYLTRDSYSETMGHFWVGIFKSQGKKPNFQ